MLDKILWGTGLAVWILIGLYFSVLLLTKAFVSFVKEPPSEELSGGGYKHLYDKLDDVTGR